MDFLTGEDPGLARFRRVMRRLPHGPNCKLCAAPFEGPGGAVLRHVGFARYPGNPAICSNCMKDLNKVGVFGAEIPVSLLFADIRGSTGIGERMSPDRVPRLPRSLLPALVEGDPRQRRDRRQVRRRRGDRPVLHRASRAQPHGGRDDGGSRVAQCRRASRRDPTGPIPVGAAVHRGQAFVGSTGANEAVNDFTALGDVVNTTARLASEAAAGELLVSIEAALAGDLDVTALDHRTLAVRGRSDAIEVVSLPEAGSSAARQRHR